MDEPVFNQLGSALPVYNLMDYFSRGPWGEDPNSELLRVYIGLYDTFLYVPSVNFYPKLAKTVLCLFLIPARAQAYL